MRLWHWMRVVLPPWWVVVLAALFYFAPILFFGFEWLLLPENLIERDGSVANAMRRVHEDSPFVMFKIVILMLYGAWRVIGLHPLFRTDYRRWLEATPWNLAHPLPLGPIHVAWQDVILLGGIVALESWSNPVAHPLTPITCFLAGYLPVLAVTFRVTGLRPMDYLLAYGVGAVLLLLLAGHEVAACGLGVGLYGAAYWGLRRSLAKFPWDRNELERWDRYRKMALNNEEQPRLGWPYYRLTTDPPRVRMDLMESVLLSGLVGWWVFVLIDQLVSEHNWALGIILFWTMFWALVGRMGIYMWGHNPPINLMGRLFTARWVIPRYDVLFAAPILAVAAGSALCLMLVELGWSWWSATPPGITATLFLAFYLGPNLDRWRLTAPARLHPTDTKKQTKI